jgi:endoglucanase Acf2
VHKSYSSFAISTGFFNDMHFHYGTFLFVRGSLSLSRLSFDRSLNNVSFPSISGYHIYAAAVVSHFDHEWGRCVRYGQSILQWNAFVNLVAHSPNSPTDDSLSAYFCSSGTLPILPRMTSTFRRGDTRTGTRDIHGQVVLPCRI